MEETLVMQARVLQEEAMLFLYPEISTKYCFKRKHNTSPAGNPGGIFLKTIDNVCQCMVSYNYRNEVIQ